VMAESCAERDAMGEHSRERDEVFEWSGTPLPEPGAHQSAHSQARMAANYMGNLRRDSDAEALKTRDGFVNALKQHPDTVWSAAVAGKSEDEVAVPRDHLRRRFDSSEGVKIGGTTLKIRLKIQWNVSAKVDSLCA